MIFTMIELTKAMHSKTNKKSCGEVTRHQWKYGI